MNPAEARKLLGGYASGILTEQERKALFEAALEDQELFEALADEQALREVLAAPAARQHLLRALDRQPVTGFRAWLQKPKVWALSAATAAAAIMTLVVSQHVAVKPALQMARNEAPAALQAPPPPPAETASMPPPKPASAPPEKAKTRELADTARERRQEAELRQDERKEAVSEPVTVAVAPPAPVLLPEPPPPAAPAAQPVRDSAAAPASQRAPMAANSAGPAQGFAMGRLSSASAMARKKTAAAEHDTVPGAVAGGRGLAKAVASPPYVIQKRSPDGSFITAPAGADFAAGDTVRIQVQPTADGFLYVFEKDGANWTPVPFAASVQRAATYLLPAVSLNAPGVRVFRLVFSPELLSNPDPTSSNIEISLKFR